MKRIARIKVGDEVKLTENYLDFWLNDAYEMCSLNGTLQTEEDAIDYMARKMLGLRYSYKAVVKAVLSPGVSSDPVTGEALSGYSIKVTLKNGVQFESAVGIDNVSLFKRGETKL